MAFYIEKISLFLQHDNIVVNTEASNDIYGEGIVNILQESPAD